MAENVNIRPAERKDCESISKLIKELALYEKMEECAKLSGKDLERDGFDSNPPYFYCLVAELELEEKSIIVGYSLYFYRYSTWEGKAIHLEDFYVTPEYRHKGIGTKFLKALAKKCVDEDFCRLTFEVLNWNEPSIKYYEKMNAVDYTKKDGWLTFRFLKDTLKKLAQD